MKIKICGIRSIEEARWAVMSGADFLGFNFYPASPRSILPAECRRIVDVLRDESPSTLLVGVFVNTPTQEVLQLLNDCDLDLAQLSGDESLEEQNILGERAYKAVRLSNRGNIPALGELCYHRKTPPAMLLDAFIPGQYGGTGQRTDWELAASVAAEKPIFLAGGLTPENVAEAIARVRPWGVDVASGVEAAAGRKDPQKVRSFISNARKAFAEFRKEI